MISIKKDKNKDKKYKVNIYYTGFCTHFVSGKDESEAIFKARNTKINKEEFLTTLESWNEADTVEKIKDEKSKF